MTKDLTRTLSTFILLLGVIVYSIGAFAYFHDKFVSKDSFMMMVDDIKYIRSRVDDLGKRDY